MPTTYIFICNHKPPDQRGQLYNVLQYIPIFPLKDKWWSGVGGPGGGDHAFLGRAENYIHEGNIEEVNNGYVVFK